MSLLLAVVLGFFLTQWRFIAIKSVAEIPILVIYTVSSCDVSRIHMFWGPRWRTFAEVVHSSSCQLQSSWSVTSSSRWSCYFGPFHGINNTMGNRPSSRCGMSVVASLWLSIWEFSWVFRIRTTLSISELTVFITTSFSFCDRYVRHRLCS